MLMGLTPHARQEFLRRLYSLEEDDEMTADVSHWIANLSSPDIVLVGQAAEALAKMGPDAKAAAVPLVRAVAINDETVREWVVSALESLDAPHEEDVPALTELMGSEEGDVAYWAITLLGRLEGQAAPAVPELTWALKQNPHPHNRQRAAWALGKIGPLAKDALPALKEAAHGSDSRLARIALLAMEQITEPSGGV
jgi:HEAT repeat protein